MIRHREGDRKQGRGFRLAAWALVCALCAQTLGCAGGMRVMPVGTRVSTVHPIRYYDLWEMLRRGRGVLVGLPDGRQISGRFVSAGRSSITVETDEGDRTVKLAAVTYLVNVIDLTQSREGAVVGGVIGAGAGMSLALATNGTGTAVAPASRPARVLRGADTDPDDSSESSAEDTESTTSESSADTSPSGSASEESASSTSDDAENASNGGSSADATESQSNASGDESTGSTTSETDEASSTSDEASSGSSTGTDSNPSTTESSESSGNSTVIIDAEVYSSGSSAGAETTPGQPRERTGAQKAWRTFFYSFGFAALGAFIGWTVGKRMQKRVPRVDYILLAPNAEARRERSPRQHLADQLITTTDEYLTETLLPGSRFDSPRSASYYERCAADGEVVALTPDIGSVIDASEARRYKLFPSVDRFEQASIVRCDESREYEGTESRYLAIITRENGPRPEVTVQRLSVGDVIRIGTQVRLLDEGILR